MKIVDAQKKDLMTVKEISRDGNTLLVKGRIFGTMPVTARLTPEEARNGLKLMTPGLIWFLLTFLFRRSPPPPPK